MLIKAKDPSEKALQQLEEMSQIPDLLEDTVANIEREIKTLKAGDRGEQDSAYYIDFYYKDSKNWAIIHDLRIECGGNVAQIDHLLIDRLFEFYILESKSYAYGVKITDRGEFSFWHKNHYISIPSPIEQNKRHILVLEELLKREDILPKRLGISIRPTYKSYVLISPKSNVIRPSGKEFNTDMVIKSDELFRQIQKETDQFNATDALNVMIKLISTETLIEFSERLISQHRPSSIDYYAKFDIKPSIVPKQKSAEAKSYFCAKCKKPISQKVALFCFQNKTRFGGKAYCFECQKTF